MSSIVKIYTKNRSSGVNFHLGQKSGKTLCGKWLSVAKIEEIKSLSSIEDGFFSVGCKECKKIYKEKG